MTITPSTRFSKKNWLKFHHNHCSKLAKYTFETILTGDSIVAGLSRYQNIWDMFLKSLKALNCGIGGDRIEHVLWRALNLPVFSSQTNYSCVNVIICGILPRDDSWSVNRVYIKKLNQILRLKCYESSYIFVSYDSG